MSVESKRKSRLGFGVYRINRKGIGCRTIAQIITDTPIVDHIYFADLNHDLYQSILKIQRICSSSMEFDLPHIDYEWELHDQETDGNTYIYDNHKEDSPLRMIVSDEAINIKVKDINKIKHLADVTVSDSDITPSFRLDTAYPKTVSLKMTITDVIFFSECFFLDISMANSLPIRTVTSKLIEKYGYESLFKLKAEFVVENDLGSKIYPRLTNQSLYANFAVLCHDGSSINYQQYVDIWDKFVTTKLKEFLPTREEIYKYINSKKGHDDQINKSKLFDLLGNLSSNINVIIIPHRKPTKAKHFKEAISKYRFKENCSEHWHLQLGALDWKSYQQKTNGLVQNTFVEPFKIYLGEPDG